MWRKGNRFIFLYRLNTFSVTIVRFQTFWAKPGMLVCMFNWNKSLENRKGEKEIKSRKLAEAGNP